MTTLNAISKARLILETCLDATDSSPADLALFEAKDLIKSIIEKMNSEDDFCIDNLPCGEVRIINAGAIDEIWTESLIEQIKDCYDLSEVPSFVEIDWEKTAENCKVDGLGHHFNGYNGEEHNAQGFHIFRTN